MNKTEITELSEYMLYIHNSEWICELDNRTPTKKVHLGLVVEAIDLRDIDSQFDNEPYPIVLETQIVVDSKSLSKRYLRRVYHGSDLEFKSQPKEAWQLESYHYDGGVPIDMESISSNAKSSVDNEVRTLFSQRRGEFKQRQFRTIEDALQYAKEVYSENALAVFTLVGFYLDRTLNLVGTTGWEIVELQALNKNYM